MVGRLVGLKVDCKYLHSTICVEVSLLDVNGAMWVLSVEPTPTGNSSLL